MARLNHIELQSAVTQLLKMTGWRWLHVRRSIGKGRQWVTTTNVKGWPDLAPCWNPRQPGRVLAIELKVPPDKPSDDQHECLVDLDASGVETYVITEAHLELLAEILRPRTGSTIPCRQSVAHYPPQANPEKGSAP